jgi:ATP-binding cassette subfamily F protein 3
MILSCSHVCKAFEEKVVINGASFHVEDKEKAAVVGINGAGKTTLLRIIVGEETADDGIVTISKDKTFGYLSQHQVVDSDRTIFEEMLKVKQEVIDIEQRLRMIELEMNQVQGERLEETMDLYAKLTHRFEQMNGFAYKSEITGVLKGLGFGEEDFHKPIRLLSGGQKTRVALGRILLSKPDLLILDEPTNHLDLESIKWLETFLLNYDGAVIIVSHDRYFLDRIVTKVIELDHGEVNVFLGNYTAYSEKKAQLRNARLREYLNQQAEIKHQEAVITKLKQFNREKSIKRAESREKMLDKIERVDKPRDEEPQMNLTLEPRILSGNDVLTIEGLTKEFDGQVLFHDVYMDIRRGERVALIGSNGTGKTTILKLINGILAGDAGTIRLGAKVEIGYYDQEHNVLNFQKTIFEEIADDYPELTNTRIRNVLAAFMFTGDDVFKKIEVLSGGERARVSLAKLMLSNANFLVLDEPTNHLDVTSREILENALRSYTGTVLYVSHDRYFINVTATRILELFGQGITSYLGNYDDYENELQKQETAKPVQQEREVLPEKSSRQEWKNSREEQAAERKRKNELKKLEEKIAQLEERNTQIAALYEDHAIATDTAKLIMLHEEKEKNTAELELLYEKWEKIAE